MSRATFIGGLLGKPRAEVTMQRIIERTALVSGVAPAAILGRDKSRVFSHPRQDAQCDIYLTKRFSLSQIGRKFGCDHSTVSANIRRSAERRGIILRPVTPTIPVFISTRTKPAPVIVQRAEPKESDMSFITAQFGPAAAVESPNAAASDYRFREDKTAQARAYIAANPASTHGACMQSPFLFPHNLDDNDQALIGERICAAIPPSLRARNWPKINKAPAPTTRGLVLVERRRRIAALIAQGMTSRDIAFALRAEYPGLTVNQVKADRDVLRKGAAA